MKLKVTITSEVYVDLDNLPFDQWPKECKDMARSLVSNPRIQREFLAQLPAFRKSWLAIRVERLSEGSIFDTL